jgi:acyl carrier protein
LSEFLGAKLPPWMIPSVYLPIEVFQLTPHGKVDYTALPAPIVGSARTDEETSGSDLEELVAGVWRQVLGADHVGLEDNFFDIGGTSLLLVSVHSKLQTLLNRKISIADLFGYTTVRALADRLGAGTADSGSTDSAQQSIQDRVQSQAQKQRAAFARARTAKKATV